MSPQIIWARYNLLANKIWSPHILLDRNIIWAIFVGTNNLGSPLFGGPIFLAEGIFSWDHKNISPANIRTLNRRNAWFRPKMFKRGYYIGKRFFGQIK